MQNYRMLFLSYIVPCHFWKASQHIHDELGHNIKDLASCGLRVVGLGTHKGRMLGGSQVMNGHLEMLDFSISVNKDAKGNFEAF